MKHRIRGDTRGGCVEEVPAVSGDRTAGSSRLPLHSALRLRLRSYFEALAHRSEPLKRATAKLALVVSILFAVGLFAPTNTTPTLDGEYWWPVAIHDAFAKGRLFGSEIIFTFGPWGAVTTQGYHPSTLALSTLLRALLTTISTFALWDLIIRRTGHASIAALVTILASLLGAICWPDMIGTFWPFLVLFQGFAIPERRASAFGLVLIVASAMLSLAKFSTLIAVGIALTAVTIDDLCQRKRPTAMATFLGSLVALWIAANQSLAGIPAFLAGAIEITRGYGEAMGVGGNQYQRQTFAPFLASAALFAIALAVLSIRRRIARPSVYLSAFLLLLLILFKWGFVRADHFHIAPACGTLFLVQLVHLAIVFGGDSPGVRRRFLAASLALPLLIAGYLVLIFVQESPVHALRLACSQSIGGLRKLLNWNAYEDGLRRNHAIALSRLPGDGETTLIRGTADAYPYPSGIVMREGIDYRPRPVIMSYSAYSPLLARTNARHLAASPPESILFDIAPIDRRYPSLEDGASWPWLLAGYDVAGSVEGALVLHRRFGSPPPRLEMASVLEGRIGERLLIPPAGANPVFARIELVPSIVGRALETIYKAPELEISVELEDGTARTRRLIRSMAASEFLLSPYIQDPLELASLFPNAAPSSISSRAVRSLTISPRGNPGAFEPRYTVTLLHLRR